MNKDEVACIIKQYKPHRLSASRARRAAVLVPFRYSEAQQIEIVFIRRTESSDAHSGQVAFPGGKQDRADFSAEATALRETREEIGVHADQVELWGRLDETITVTGFHIVPVVGWLNPSVIIKPNLQEVASVFSVPLAHICADANWKKKPHRYQNSVLWSWHLRFMGDDIWGATARILQQCVMLLRRQSL